MNTHYKIDKDTVVVTEETGNMRMMPKYTHIEDILVLENEIEQIDGEILEKRAIIESNKLDRFYIGRKKSGKAVTVMTLLMLVCATGIIISNMIPILTFIKYPFVIGFGFNFILDMIACYCADKARNLSFQNEKLEQEIDWLQQIRNQKEEKKEKFKRSINKKMLEREEKQLPQPISPLDELKMFSEYLKDYKDNEIIQSHVHQAIQTLEARQKLLNKD